MKKRLICLFPFLLMAKILAADSSLTVIAAGDVMLGSWAQNTIFEKGYAYPTEKISEVLKEGNIIFANLEGPFGVSGARFVNKEYTFQVDPRLVQVLKEGGINLVSLANNHIMDFGEESLKETIQILQENQIYFAGAGSHQKVACQPYLFEVEEHKIAFFSFSLTFPEDFWATDSSAGTCFPSHTFIYKNIKEIRPKVDFILVSNHWGQELMETPKDYQRELAHKLIDAGVDLVLGHHPHVLQGIEIYKGKIIAYSLGNFIFGSYSEKVRTSMILKIFLGTGQPLLGKIFPINVYNKEVEFQPMLLNGKDKEAFLAYLSGLSRELNQGLLVISSDGFISIKNNNN